MKTPKKKSYIEKEEDEGLNLTNIKHKIRAYLLTNFLQTAVNEEFNQNLYHKSLYEYHIHNIGLKPPPLPPYYSKDFFQEIRDTENEGYETKSMKIKDWYSLLIKKYITHQKHNNELILKPSRMEIIYPQIVHSNSFHNIRKIGLPSSKMTPLWKLKYDLYLTQERKKYCQIALNNRCQNCQKLDSTGHFLMCTKAKPKKLMQNSLITVVKLTQTYLQKN